MNRMSDSEMAAGASGGRPPSRSRSGSVAGRQRRGLPAASETMDTRLDAKAALNVLWGELYFVVAAVICVALFVFCCGQLPAEWGGKPVFFCVCGFLSLLGFLFAFSIAAAGRQASAGP